MAAQSRTLGVGVAEALGPADELAVVDAVLLHGVGEGESEREFLFEDDVAVGVAKVVLDEGGDAVCAEVKELLTLGLLLLLGETELGLGDLELAGALEDDVADAEVGAAEVERNVGADLVARGPAKDVGGKHGDGLSVLLEALFEHADEAVGDHAESLRGDGEELLEAFVDLLELLFVCVWDVLMLVGRGVPGGDLFGEQRHEGLEGEQGALHVREGSMACNVMMMECNLRGTRASLFPNHDACP